MDNTTCDLVPEVFHPSAVNAVQPTRCRPTMAAFKRISERRSVRFKSENFREENLKLQKAQLMAFDKQKLALKKRENIEKHLSSLPNAIEGVVRELSILRQVYVVVNKYVEVAMEE
jgi:hypothetical protein